MASDEQRSIWREAKRRSRRNNPDVIKRDAEWQRNNPEKRKAIKAKHLSNPKNRERSREYSRMRAKAKPEVYAAMAARRRAAILERTPEWSDAQACVGFYQIAARVSKCLGISFEVDHIEPLVWKDRSGLHVPYNLRVIPKYANQRKGNRPLEKVS